MLALNGSTASVKIRTAITAPHTEFAGGVGGGVVRKRCPTLFLHPPNKQITKEIGALPSYNKLQQATGSP